MRKNIIYLIACTAITILAVSCASISEDDAAQKTVSEFVLTYAENQVEGYPITQGTYKLAEPVCEKTGGRVEMQVNAGGVLGGEKTVIKWLQFGDVDFARVSLSSLAEFVSKLNVLQVSYLYTGWEYIWKVLEGPIGTNLMNSSGGSNLAPSSWCDTGARNFYSTNGPIEPLDDMKELKIRVQESELMMDTIQALGAAPVPMIFGDVYSGLQTGKIDGAGNNWPFYESTRHYEVTQYFTLDEHTRVPELQLVAQSTWGKLPEEYGNIIRDCARGSTLYERRLWAEHEKTSEDRVRGAGCVVTELDIRKRERFREIAAPMYKKYCSEYVDIIDDIMDAERQ